MSLTSRQRSSIFQKLVSVLGEEDADALMAQFPAAEHDVLVTREHLRAELAELRAAMSGLATKEELAELRVAMQGLATKEELAELRVAMQGLATEDELALAIAPLVTRDELRAELAELTTAVHAHINRAMGATTAVLLAAMSLFAVLI